ncbi:MAG: TIGR04282 family arsenosugar biosynthesis glycosyltransferase [Pseudomonadota bacterium]
MSGSGLAGTAVPRLYAFVKQPVLGRVKTRLARDVGATEATRFYRGVSAAVLRRLSGDARWRLIAAVDPPAALGAPIPGWPGRARRVPQAPGDLGARMGAVFRAARGPTAIIGTDAPALRAHHVATAFDALRRADAVFGLAEDGGYWLIGLAGRRAAPDLFKGVRWSSPHALEDTIASLPRGFRIEEAARLPDVDDGADYARAAALGLRGF